SLIRDLRFFREHDIQALPAARFPPGRERELVMTALLLPTAFRTLAATAQALSTPALALKLAAQLDKCQDAEAKDMAEQEYLTDEQRATLAEARRQLRDAGPRGTKLCTGVLAQQGQAAVACQFGPKGKRAQPNGPQQCLFCDVTKLNEAFLDRSGDVVRARYNKLTAAAKAMALDRVADPGIRQFLTQTTLLCAGFRDPQEDCIFALSRTAAAAQTHKKKIRCLFCDPAAMATKCGKAKGLKQVERDLLRMSLASRRKALEERVPAEQRAALRLVLQQPEPEVVHCRRTDKSWVGEEPYTPEELEARYRAGREKWAPVLAARALVALPDISAEQYRDQMVADRNKSLNMMNVPHERLPRGAEVSNEDPLPKASVTRLAANLQLWCEFNSWQVCPKCQLLQPRVLTPAGLDGLLEPWCGPKACRVCRGLQKPSVPQHESTPAQLAGLSPAARAALCPVEAYYGPEVRARDRFGRGNGYREHSSMVRFSWHQLSVEDRIQELSEENRREATRALRWLLRQSGSEKTKSAYGEFYQEHHEFLQRTPDATDRQRKRWLRFLEREGLECALWPDLFLDRQTCLTWVRMQSTSRQVAAHGSTLQERYFPLDEAAGEDDEPIEDTFASTKRAYIALVLSPTLDYSCSYELLHFAYDLNLWTALGAKKNKGLPIPMRLLMRRHSFSEEFWKDMRRALVDLVRQKGFPPVFSTRSPLEWSFPYHVAVVNTMEKARRGRMLLPVHETLHQTHVLTQVGLNFEGGHNKPAERAKKGHEQQLLKLRRPDGGQVKLTSFQRVEFQDGKRKAPTQDYHGSGRAHSHSLEFVGKENRAADLAALKLDLCVSASGSSGDVFVDGYVQASQKDRQGRTPFPLHEGESHFDTEAGRYVLRHTKQDVEDGIRGYYPATMALTKCHEDVQLCYDDENYTLYTTAYAPKFSDSMRRELLNDDADADSIAASVLMRYKPCEPEMILQLFGAMFRQWRVTTASGGKRSFTVPVPDNPDQPREVRLYQQCSWRSEDMSMLEFLRKSNNEGGICGWLRELHRKSGSTASLTAFANTYKMQGEKIVACDMVSRMNDKYYGQWLVLHVPFSSVTDFVKPNVLLLVPAADKYLGMCLACEHAVARSHWHTPRLELLMEEDMKLEARTRIYRQQVAARLAPHVKKVLAYLEGTALKPADPTAQELRAQQQPARKRHQLPIQRRYEGMIDAGDKTIEGRINHGAAARVMEGDILVLGSTPSLVQAIYTYRSFSAMLEDLGVENALPDVDTLEEALEIYHGFNNYETLARLFGVRAFLLAPVPVPAEADEEPQQATEWNAEQERWAMIVEEDIKRAAAVFSATTERAADEAREETWNHNKIRALEGPPGTGKTTIARRVVELAETYGLKVLWSVYTAQLASRMREVFGDRIDINTCHAALGLDEEYHNVANALQGYGLVVIDEFSQLQGKHMEHINKLRSASDRVAAFVLLGDKCQLAGFGTERVWHTRTWHDAVQATELHQLFRCKDPAFKKILACLRTAKPSETSCRGGVSVPDIMRHRRAWPGHYPTVEAVRSILLKHKNTTMLTVSRQGSAALNDLSLQALYPRRAPLAVISADVESNPENYNDNKELKPSLIRDLRFFREHDIQALPAARFPPGRERELVMTALLLPTAFRTLAATAQALSTPALALKLAAQLDKCQDAEAKDMAEQEYLTDEQRATLAEARRQLRDAGPRGTKLCTGVLAQQGQAAVACQFGPKGKRAQPNGPQQCLFCDVTKLNEAFLDRSGDVVRARYNKLTAAAKAMALDRVADPGIRQFLTQTTLLCAGFRDPQEDCIFALSRTAAAAQTHKKKIRCLFCDPAAMATKCGKAKGLKQVERDLLRMSLASRRKALEERVPAEQRAALRLVLQQPEPEVVHCRRTDKSWVGEEPYTPEELEARYRAGREKWAPVLAARALVALPDISAEQYRDQMVADRNKSLNMMNVPHERLPRGAEVSNEDPLPKASVTRLAANLQLWCEFNSWQVCPKCQLLQPRVLTPAGLDGLLEPWCGPKACRVCRGLQKPSVPQHESTPAQLAGLSPAARAALCPVEAYYGPEVRARDRFGRGNGYREHSSMVRFSWHQLSVEDRIQELSEENRREATRALRWLLRQSGSEKTKSAYGEFYQEHHEFLQRTPDATDRQRKRWLRFLEREGLECALWPDLFLDRQTCLTWVRMQSTSRQVAAHGSTLQERYFPLDEAAGEDDEPIEDTFASTKRAYIALVLSPTLDYSCSYELLHFAYDLNLWTALGAKKNKGLPIPMRLLMRGHSFSEEFWKDMHRALVDLVRQKGFPPVFSTRSPLEWSFPYHVAVVNTMEKARRGRMLLPVHETLHQTHVLTQVGLNFEGGHNKPAERAKKGHEQQLLKLRRPDGGQVKLTSFQRVEFQDGKRKAPTQDYHGSGRAHSHSLEFVGKENRAADLAALKLDLCVSASGSSGDVFVDGYVQASQKDRQGRTPFPLHEGESHFDTEAGRYVLRHTKQDVEDGIRGYYPATMAVTKCHEDVQLCYDDENYTLYTTAYAPKFSDSMRRELLNDDADADSIAASVLMRYKPCEPEMILQLFGAMFRQWRVTTASGGKRSFTVPVPDNPDQPREVRLYQQCSWRSEDMSMLEFLRKSNNEGGICGWLRELHRKSGSTASLTAFANTYKMQGEKIVACDMVSRMNDKYYGQWLVLHVPFSSVTDFVKPNVLLLVPAADKYLGMCLACEHAVARSHWHTPRLELLMEEDMKLEARTRIYRQQVAARLAPHVKKVLAYLEGTALKPADPTAQELRAQQQPARKRHQLPIQRRYEGMIDAGDKTIEGRINHGAAARVMEGDILVLGSTPSLVQAIYTYRSFSAMLEDLGVENALPDVDTLEEALEIYHGFNNYETLARLFGVRAFLLAPVPVPAEADEEPQQATEWNAEQERWAMIVEEDIKRAAAVFSATTERAADEAREETWNHNKIRALEGPPGTGKTTIARRVVELAETYGLKVLWSVYTAQLASRMREVFGDRIDINTCHAALGLDEEYHNVANALQGYGLVVIDEFSQLQGKHMEHINKLRSASDRVAAFVLLGDKCQLAGFGTERVWHTRTWHDAVQATELHQLFRCKDPAFKKILACLRTAKPSETSCRGGVSVPDI
ncbi:unnamed protein product, partial [Polarella glacialis]